MFVKAAYLKIHLKVTHFLSIFIVFGQQQNSNNVLFIDNRNNKLRSWHQSVTAEQVES